MNTVDYYLESLEAGKAGVFGTLSAVYQYLAAGINWHAKNSNALALVEFSSRLEGSGRFVEDGMVIGRYYLQMQLERISERLMMPYEVVSGMSHSEWYGLILDNWDVLKHWTITYRFLSAMAAKNLDAENMEQEKSELKAILCDVGKEWDLL